MKWRLAAFDLDGTLIVGTSVCQHVGGCFGYGQVIRDLEQQYAAGLISNREVAEQDASYYRGRSVSAVREVLLSAPIIKGAAQTFSKLRDCGMKIVVATVTWSFAAQIIADRFGLDGWCGCEMGMAPDNTFSGVVRRHFSEFDKLNFVRGFCEDRRLRMSDVIAIGDSRSDIPLFDAVGYSVALNATPNARKAATCSLDTDNLLDLLNTVPGLDRHNET